MKPRSRPWSKQYQHFKTSLKNYFRRLLHPFYLFPLKLATYSAFYVFSFMVKLILAFLGLMIDAIKFPFQSHKNLLKSVVFFVITTYILVSLAVMADYIKKEYGWYTKFFCSFDTKRQLRKSVVRIVGGFSEGSGFFITNNQVLTNFHVIDGEPSPKIIFPNGDFYTPVSIVGDQNVDLAVLETKGKYPDMVLPLQDKFDVYEDEPLLAVGYPLGTELLGTPTILKGTYVDRRLTSGSKVGYIQTDIDLVEGMSGGPLVDQCGQVVGINTLGVAGLSLFISSPNAADWAPGFTDQDIVKIEVDPTESPEAAVEAFYTYLKARRMADGFKLLSDEYLQKTDFQEWKSRFTDLIDVDVIETELEEDSKDTVFVKFSTKNWKSGEAAYHYYEGTWETVAEGGIYKMNKSNIKEVSAPSWDWYYDWEE